MNKTAIIAAAGIAAGLIAAIGIVYTECVQPQEPTIAEDAREIAKLPLTVGGIGGDAIDSAVATWNRAAGCTLLVASQDSPDIVVTRGALEPGEGGDGFIDAERAYARTIAGRIVGGYVELRAAVQPHTEYLAIAHGLGHLLGLAHDAQDNSIMDGRVLEHAGSFPLPGATDADRAALEDRYCEP